jgi:hypothetical protein
MGQKIGDWLAEEGQMEGSIKKYTKKEASFIFTATYEYRFMLMQLAHYEGMVNSDINSIFDTIVEVVRNPIENMVHINAFHFDKIERIQEDDFTKWILTNLLEKLNSSVQKFLD